MAVPFAWKALSPRIILWLPSSSPTGLCLNVPLSVRSLQTPRLPQHSPNLHMALLIPPASHHLTRQICHFSVLSTVSLHTFEYQLQEGKDVCSVGCQQGLTLGWHSVTLGTQANEPGCQQGHSEEFMQALGFR